MPSHHQAAPADRERQVLLRAGALCAVAAAIVYVAAGAPHGDLPTNEQGLLGETAALRYVAGHALWIPIHLGTVLAGMLWVGALAALAGTLSPGAARAVGRLLVPSAIIGGTFVVLDYALDGYALKVLADQWAAASGAEREALQRMAETGIWLVSGTFHNEVLTFYGLTMLLAGLAVALDGRYPRWLGRAGMAAGALATLNGLLEFAGITLTPLAGLGLDFLVFAVVIPVELLWLLALGILMWRRGGRG